MSIERVVHLTRRKCSEILQKLKRLRKQSTYVQRVTTKSNKVHPDPHLKENASSNKRNIEGNTNMGIFCSCSSSGQNRTPPFPRNLQISRNSVYENVNVSYDSAYDSEGLEFSDQPEETFSDHLAEETSGDVTTRVRSRRMKEGDKEKFENIWNETIESLVSLS